MTTISTTNVTATLPTEQGRTPPDVERALARLGGAPVDAAPASASLPWPRKFDVFGVKVSATTYAQVVDLVIQAGKARRPMLVDFAAVHPVVEAARDADFRQKLNSFDLVCPDGQPVRWALNRYYGCGLTDRVYGPKLTRELCRAAAENNVSIYLYGGTDEVLAKLSAKLLEWYPKLKIAGAWSPPFRPLTPEEDAAAVERINASGAGIVFLGIGSPKQENFAFDHRDRIRAAQLCVGAAFDFHAGVKRMAPPWMQRRGLEWLFRLCTEPRRLWKRYLVTNSLACWMVAKRLINRSGIAASL